NRVAIVLDEKQQRKLQVAGAVEGLPELAFAGRTVPGRDVSNLVVLDRLAGDGAAAIVAEPCLGAADGLEQLRARGTRLADDVESSVPPVGRHLPGPRGRVRRWAHGREQHRRRRPAGVKAG